MLANSGTSNQPSSLGFNTSNLGELLAGAILKKYNFRLTSSDLSTNLLIGVYKKDLRVILSEMEEIYRRSLKESEEGQLQNEQLFQYEVSLAFWFAIHLEYMDICNLLVQKVPMLKKIVASIFKKKQENRLISQASRFFSKTTQRLNVKDSDLPESEENIEGLNLRKSKLFNNEDLSPHASTIKVPLSKFGKNRISNSKSSKQNFKQKTFVEKQHSADDELANIIPSEIQVNTETAENIFEKFEIILQKKEERLSQIVAAYYKISLTEDILIQAIEKDQIGFIYYLFGFGKNFIYDPATRTSEQITFSMLFEYLRQKKPDDEEFQETLKDICEWRLQNSSDNFLIALLSFDQDDLAIQYMGSFGNNLNEGLLIYCLDTQNQQFLKQQLVSYYIGMLSSFVLLIKCYLEKTQLDFMDILSEFFELNYEKNKIILCYNPILTIALACEILKSIQQFRKKFENESKRICNQLLRLGEMYISKIQDEKFYEKLILDQDFRERPVLKIICQNSFEKLMDEKDPKAENLMNKIWKGQEATNCDGNLFGYSSLSNVVFRNQKKVYGTQSIFNQITVMASNSFEPNFKVDYLIQHRYRTKSISYYFTKEFFCALSMLVIFQWINYQYLTEVQLANSAKTDPNTYDQNNDSYDYSEYNDQMDGLQSYGGMTFTLSFIAYIFAFALIFQLILKIIFNFYSSQKLALDKWTIIDTISAFLNIIAVHAIQGISIDNLLTPMIKDALDYFMIFVLTLSWIRFFMYFLVVRSISKLLLTLIEMVEDTISFIFIVSCFIIIMSSIFTTLYQDINPEKYGSLTQTVRTLFDAALAVYSYDNMGGRTLSYSILMIFHVFFSNVLLLNYLIAILSTTYDNMKQSGIFKYKKNLFTYCERFIISFKEEAYGNLVLHPPPLSYLSIILLPFLKDRQKMLYYSKLYSLIMFWIDNMVIIFLLILYEIIILPLAFIKTFFIIFLSSEIGILRKFTMIIGWVIFGVFIDIYYLIKDIKNFIKILSYTNGFQENIVRSYQEDQIKLETQIEILNLARDGVILLFKALKNHFNLDGQEGRKSKRTNRSEKKSMSQRQKDISQENNDSSLLDKSSLLEDQKSENSTGSYEFSSDEDDVENFNLEEELKFLEQNAGYNPNDLNCLYVVKKSVLLEDWIARRKVQLKQKINDNQRKTIVKKPTDMKEQILRASTNRHKSVNIGKSNEDSSQLLMDDSAIEEQEHNKIAKGFQRRLNPNQLQQRKSKLIILDSLAQEIKRNKTIKQAEHLNIAQNANTAAHYRRMQSKSQVLDKQPQNLEVDTNPHELKRISKFLNNFVIVSETSLVEHVDIVLFLRALPERITKDNIHKIDLFNFKVCQESLIAYQNLDLVNAFEFFDDKNRERIQQVKEKLEDQKSFLTEIKDIVKFVKRKMYNKDRLNGGLRTQDEETKRSRDLISQRLTGRFTYIEKNGSSNNLAQTLKILSGFSANQINTQMGQNLQLPQNDQRQRFEEGFINTPDNMGRQQFREQSFSALANNQQYNFF